MSERRRHRRHGVTNFKGTLRVLRDVTVQCGPNHEFIALSRDRAVPGEVLKLDRVVNGTTVSAVVSVIDSRPVIASGSVWHRLRLQCFEHTDLERPMA